MSRIRISRQSPAEGDSEKEKVADSTTHQKKRHHRGTGTLLGRVCRNAQASAKAEKEAAQARTDTAMARPLELRSWPLGQCPAGMEPGQFRNSTENTTQPAVRF